MFSFLQMDEASSGYLDPGMKEVKFNPRYEDLYRPEVRALTCTHSWASTARHCLAQYAHFSAAAALLSCSSGVVWMKRSAYPRLFGCLGLFFWSTWTYLEKSWDIWWFVSSCFVLSLKVGGSTWWIMVHSHTWATLSLLCVEVMHFSQHPAKFTLAKTLNHV